MLPPVGSSKFNVNIANSTVGSLAVGDGASSDAHLTQGSASSASSTQPQGGPAGQGPTAATHGSGSTHHFALRVESRDEQEAWRDYLRERGVTCTDVLDRGAFHSIYVRDPDGHVIEIATRGPGFGAGEPLA